MEALIGAKVRRTNRCIIDLELLKKIFDMTKTQIATDKLDALYKILKFNEFKSIKVDDFLRFI